MERKLRELTRPRKKPEFLVNTTGEIDRKNDFTIAVCFSRRWCVRPFFEAFERLRIPMDRCHLLIYANKDSILLINELLERARAYVDSFKSVRMYCSYRRSMGTTPLVQKEKSHRGKLPFIYAMYLDVIGMVKTETMIILEDDTIIPNHAIISMLKEFEKHNRRAFISAIETNRGPHEDIKTRLGIHYLKRRGDRILERMSLDPDTKGQVRVDACGWYCCISTPAIWKLGFQGIEKYFHEIPRFALDNFHTNNIKRAGIPVIADFDIWCKHMEIRPDKIIFWGKKQCVKMADVWLPRYKTYAQGITWE